MAALALAVLSEVGYPPHPHLTEPLHPGRSRRRAYCHHWLPESYPQACPHTGSRARGSKWGSRQPLGPGPGVNPGTVLDN